ncbi:DUF4355 domain-containing protein [Clostridium beijerinckii]|uniref:DUF4355 domain-containing protein n=1 Tax=Clostridium beijerinckii TaxID=1520 RepID=UPI00098CC05A|nr:DUF4355 domain-containing protein [Clostridium beijerinckii]NRT78124.1 hypothetical protein [Clostridium beijerinckii]OOM44796.1 hypothetical protein CBEIJ_35420 [Clostridium beijerinckii]
MKKIDISKLIETLGDEDNVLNVLKDNEEFKGFAKSLSDINNISAEDFKNLLANNKEVKGYYTSSVDSAISKAINTHDEKFMAEKFPQLVEEEIKKRSNVGKTEDQIKYEDLQKEFEKMKTENAREKLSSKYVKVLGEQGLNPELIDFVLGQDEDTTNKNIEKISNIINSQVQKGVKTRFGESAYTPPSQDIKDDSLVAQLNEVMGVSK